MRDAQEKILNKLKFYHPNADVNIVIEALNFTEKAHKGQRRDNGEPYITHPLAVANTIADMGLDEKTIAASILHDVVEDTDIGLEIIQKKFGNEISELVDGVTKLLKIPEYERNLQEYEIENIRKLFLYTANDVRVIIMKLADRLHNMQTLYAKPPEKRQKIALETMNIYAPIANRLSIGNIKGKLEDLAFPYVFPEAYRWIKTHVKDHYLKRQNYINRKIKEIKKILAKDDINYIDVHGRAKHLYSLYKKLLRKEMDIYKIHDLVAIRIIVSNIPDCYRVLGAVHSQWSPLPTTIKDYIAAPKINGYQSLHTTVMIDHTNPMEIQIRTQKMHEEAEFGIAAHWHYDLTKGTQNAKLREQSTWQKVAKIFRRDDSQNQNIASWLKQISNLKDQSRPSKEFIQQVQSEILKDHIVVFSDDGKTTELPIKSTALDFAYHLGEAFGNHCVGARVNGSFTSIFKTLNNADTVKIITDNEATPSKKWLKYVKTPLAKEHIRGWFKNQEILPNIKKGKQMLKEELIKNQNISMSSVPKHLFTQALQKLNLKTMDDLFFAIGNGDVTVIEILKLVKIDPVFAETISRKTENLEVKDLKYIKFEPELATCCNPVLGDPIIAELKGKALLVHHKACKKAPKNESDKIKIQWRKYTGQLTQFDVSIKAAGRTGLMAEIAKKFAEAGVGILGLETHHIEQEIIEGIFTTETKNIESIYEALREIRRIKNIIEARLLGQ